MYYCQNCGSPLGDKPNNFCPNCDTDTPSSRKKAEESFRFSGRMTRPELKQAAKDRLSGNWGKAIGLGLVMDSLLGSAATILFSFFYSILISVAAFVIQYISQEYLIALLLVLMAVSLLPLLIFWGPLKYGHDAFYLQLFRERKPSFSLLFRGFSCFGKSCWMGVLKFLMLTGWTLLFTIPGIVKSYAYSMSYFILRDHPEMTAREAITASKELMKGNKGELFVLHLSFIGWAILSYLTYGLLELFYVRQYRNACLAAFYEELKARKTPHVIPESERPLWDRPLWDRPDLAAEPIVEE